MIWYVASADIESCLRKQNHIIEKFYAKAKIFGFKLDAGLSIKPILLFSVLASKIIFQIKLAVINKIILKHLSFSSSPPFQIIVG